MARKIAESVKVEDQEKVETVVESSDTLDETAASDTLRPNSMPVGPANKSAAIGKIVNAFAGMSPEAINHFWEMINGVGHEADSLPNNKEKNAASVSTKPSDASTANLTLSNKIANEEAEINDKAIIDEDLKALFEGTDLAEDTREKFTVLFESAVNLKAAKVRVELEEAYETALEEELEAIATNLAEEVNNALDAKTAAWLEENKVAIESTLTRDMTEEFLEDMRAVFEKHYVTVPEDKVDVLEELADRIEALEAFASEKIEALEEAQKIIDELTDTIESLEVDEAFDEVAEGLTVSEVEKLKTLSEGIEYTDVEDFKKKATIIRESHFAKSESTKVINKPSTLFEEAENIESDVEETPKVVGNMARYVAAIRSTAR